MGCANGRNANPRLENKTASYRRSKSYSQIEDAVHMLMEEKQEPDTVRDEHYLDDDSPVNPPLQPFYDFIQHPIKLAQIQQHKIEKVPTKQFQQFNLTFNF